MISSRAPPRGYLLYDLLSLVFIQGIAPGKGCVIRFTVAPFALAAMAIAPSWAGKIRPEQMTQAFEQAVKPRIDEEPHRWPESRLIAV
jgi:hypothetical protein